MALTLEQQKAIAIAEAKLKLSQSQGTQPPTVATTPDQPFFRAPDFAGISYFDEEFGRIKAEEQEILKDYKSPDFAERYQSLADREKQLFEQRKEFLSYRPEEIRDLPEWAPTSPLKTQPEGISRPREALADLLGSEEKDMVSQLEQAGYKIDFVQGFPKITNPSTGEEYQLNEPNLSPRDVKNFISTAFQFLPASRASGTARTIAGKVAVGAVGSGITEAARQGIETALGGEFDLGEVGLASLFGGATELAIPALRGVWNKLSTSGREKLLAAQSVEDIRKLGIASESELKEIQQLVDRARTAQTGVKEATGVDVPVFRGQATGLPSQQLEQRFLAQIDPTSRKALDALRSQNDAAYEATVSIINQIAPEETIEFAGRQLRDAAQKAVAAKQLIREQATSPLYDAAKAESKKNPLKLTQFKESLGSRIDGLDPDLDVRRVLSRFKGFVDRSGGDLEKLQEAKFFLDDELAKVTDKALGKQAKRRVAEVKEEFLSSIDEESDLFRIANEEFAAQSGPVDEIINSMVGRAADLGDDQLNQAARKIFNKDVTPGEVLKAKKVIEAEDPEAWNQIVRRELWNRVSGMEVKAEEQGVEAVSNMAAQLRKAIYGNPTQRRVLFQSVDGEPRKNLMFLETLLESAASGRAAGSPTTPFAKIVEKLGGSFRVVKQAITSPVEAAARIGDESIFNRNARALSDIAFDPQWLERMSKIRALGKTEEAATELSKLLDDAIRVSAQAQRDKEPTDQERKQARATEIQRQDPSLWQ